MARTKTPLSSSEIKTKKSDLTAAKKVVNATFARFVSDHKAATKAAAAAAKAVDVAAAKLAKATEARDKGLAKIDAQLAALTSA